VTSVEHVSCVRRSGFSQSFANVPFASCFIYSPRASGLVADASRRICKRVKRSDPLWIPGYAGFVFRESLRDRKLAALFTSATLIPVPGSAPCNGDSWPSLQLAVALSQVGFQLRLWVGLRRQVAVRKSATAPNAERPTVQQHYESFFVRPPARPIRKILLIDDVITKGRTLLGAAARLQMDLPPAEICAFALIRTLGFVERMDHLTDICHGFVRWAGGDARREP